MSALRTATLLLAVLMTAVAGSPAGAQQRTFLVPSSYVGTIPCADCEAIRVTITFDADGTYALKRAYEGGAHPNSYIENGRWSYDKTAASVTLHPAGKASQSAYYRVSSANSITMLDSHGDPIHSKLNFTLLLAATPIPIGSAPLSLSSSDWYLVALGDQKVITASGGPAPMLKFTPPANVSGNTGCNHLAGTYSAGGGQLRFSPLATTRMACAETAMLEMSSSTRSP